MEQSRLDVTIFVLNQLMKLQELSHLNVVEHPLESAPACVGWKFFYIKEDST